MIVSSARYRAVLAYVGTDFSGWQIQRNAPRTVQAVLEDALARVAGQRVRALAAGRTDAGVHADGQVVHFDMARDLPPPRVRDAVNALLPWDVKVLSVDRACPQFHARRDAVWKEYLYRWSRAAVIPPREAPFVSPLSPRADVARMRVSVPGIVGQHDFGVFAVRRPPGQFAVRTIYSLEIEEEDEEVRAVFRGDAFLRGMVRAICGVLAAVARGKAPVDRVARLLETADRRLLAPKAPACGLTLLRVAYRDAQSGDLVIGSSGDLEQARSV